MCQKAPGPRCSPHAYETMQKALTTVNNTNPNNQAAYATAQENLEESIKDYSSTPKGLERIKELHKQARKNKDTTEAERLATLYKSSKQRVVRRKEGLKELEQAEKNQQQQLDRKTNTSIAECADYILEEYQDAPTELMQSEFYSGLKTKYHYKTKKLAAEYKKLIKEYTEQVLDENTTQLKKLQTLHEITSKQNEQHYVNLVLAAIDYLITN